MDRLHLRRLRLPDRGARDDRPAGGAVCGLSHRARAAHRRARRRPGDRPPVRGRARRLPPHGQPPRLLARAAAPELPLAHPRGRRARDGGRQDQRHLRGLRHRRLAADALQRRRARPHRGAGARRLRRARVREPGRDRHDLRAPQRPGGLSPLPAGDRCGHPRPARRARPGRPAGADLRPRLRSDDGFDRSFARVRAADRTRAGPRARAAATTASSPTSARRWRRGSERARATACRVRRSPCEGRRADRAQARRRRARAGRDHVADRGFRRRRRGARADERVGDGGRLPRALGRRDARADAGDDRLGRDHRPLVARPHGRRQALDRRRGGQDDDRPRAARGGHGHAGRQALGPRPRAHRRHARQAGVDPRLPRRA